MGWPLPRTSSKAQALSDSFAAVNVSPAPQGTSEQVARLREDLLEAGYTVAGLNDLLGPVASGALLGGQRLPADRLTRDISAAPAVLVRLFVLGLPVTTGACAAALPRTGVPGAVALGLIREAADGFVRGLCDLRPYADEQHDWWVASDLTSMATGAPLAAHHVVGVGGASSTLASWTPRPAASRALDLGTGSGVQALHLGGHSAYRMVTDVSHRALEFAAFTCELNGIEVDARAGSLFTPVAGEVFDLIVCNPPFVITPRAAGLDTMEYRDGGAVGDELVASVVAQVGDYLAPGGIAQLLGNWELGAGQDWADRVRSWLPRDLDAWVIQREEQDVADYAMTWARDAGHAVGTPGFERWYAAWLDDFAARGVGRIGFGIITIQRPSQDRATFTDCAEVTTAVASPMGPSILRGLRARAWLALHDDDELLAVPWSVADDVTEERIGRPGAPDPMVIQLRQGGGLRRVVRLDSLSAGLLGALDGELTADQIVQALAALTDTAAADVRQGVVPIVRSLVADGLLH